MAQSLLQFNPARIRSYIFRIPLCTRLILVVIFAFWIASLYVPWLRQWAALLPSQVNLGTSMSLQELYQPVPLLLELLRSLYKDRLQKDQLTGAIPQCTALTPTHSRT